MATADLTWGKRVVSVAVCEASGGPVLGDQARSLITRRTDEDGDIK